MNELRGSITFENDIRKLNEILQAYNIFDEEMLQISNKTQTNRNSIEILNVEIEIYKSDFDLSSRFNLLNEHLKDLYDSLFEKLKENQSLKEMNKNLTMENLVRNHNNLKEKMKDEQAIFLQDIAKKKESNIILKKHIVCLEESINYLEKHLECLNEKITKLMCQRFETHNEIYLKNLEDKKKANQSLLITLKLEIQEIQGMYEKKIEMKEEEIKTISENYKKRLYEKFNEKISKGVNNVENEPILFKENHKKAQKFESGELKMKILEHETKMKKKQKKGGKKERLDEFNSKFYQLRK